MIAEAPPSRSGPHMQPDQRSNGHALIRLDKIRIDGGTQARAGLDEATVAEYRDAYQSAAAMPPTNGSYPVAALRGLTQMT